MNCPVCDNTRMREVEKDGILIDVCPTCKGVWLDRGELEKLMQEVREVRQDYNEWYYGSNNGQPSSPPQSPSSYQQPSQQPQYQQQPRQQQYDGSHPHGHPKHKKKKSVMDVFGDLFD
jgi:Zn-finger nucleic acid-binding protein